MKLFVTGTKGQVVSALSKKATDASVSVLACGRPDLDLASPDNVRELIEQSGADVVVSVAAYTAVDQAETESELAYAINKDGPGALATAAAELGLPIVHVSTDYVFAGDKADGAYSEADPIGPTSVYGASKLAGEESVAAANPRHAILRTAWVYSETGKNFLKTMLRVGASRDELGVVSDQFGAPTHADAIADGIFKVSRNLLEQPENSEFTGVFHMSCAGSTSWHGFAEAIFEDSLALGGPNPKVNAIKTEAYPTPARRPENSRLNCDKIGRVHGVIMPNWRDPIALTVAQVLNTAEA